MCVGSIGDVHGQALLVEAIARQEAPRDVVLDFVGGGEAAALRRHAEALKVAGRVRFAGPVPPAQVPVWYAAADASAHPGRWAGSPNAVLESLACGTPCLASDLPEMREAIPTRSEGLFAERTPVGFARGLMALLAARVGTPRPPRTWTDVGREVLAYFEERCSAPAGSRST